MNIALGLAKANIRHKRFAPKVHDFSYQIGYIWIDIHQMDEVFNTSSLWSLNRWNIISLTQKDYLPATLKQPKLSIEQAVYQLIEQQHGITLSSATIKLLTIPRFIGYSFNPVSFYFVFSQSVDFPDFIIADITNTPWGERYAYCLDCKQQNNATEQNIMQGQNFTFDKVFHVSPFMPMNLQYQWRFTFHDASNATDRSNCIHMKLMNGNDLHFFANMEYTIEAMKAKDMRLYPLQFPMQSLKVIWGIYWQALKIKLKGIPFFKHPNVSKEKT